MIEKLPKLTPAEIEIMEVIWDSGNSRITDVLETLNSTREKKVKRSTVQMQIQKLDTKGWLTHQESRYGFSFTPTVDRNTACIDIISDVHEKIFKGSSVDLVKALFDNTEISSEDLCEIHKMVKNMGKSQNANL